MSEDLPEKYADRITMLFRAIFNETEIDPETLQDSKEIFRHCCDSKYKMHIRLIYRAFPITYMHSQRKYGSYVKLLLDMLHRHALPQVVSHN